MWERWQSMKQQRQLRWQRRSSAICSVTRGSGKKRDEEGDSQFDDRARPIPQMNSRWLTREKERKQRERERETAALCVWSIDMKLMDVLWPTNFPSDKSLYHEPVNCDLIVSVQHANHFNFLLLLLANKNVKSEKAKGQSMFSSSSIANNSISPFKRLCVHRFSLNCEPLCDSSHVASPFSPKKYDELVAQN